MQAMRDDSKDAALNAAVPEGPISPPQVQQTNSSWTHLVAGAAGGMATALLTSPLDVLRTRLQSDYYRSQLKSTTISSHTRLSLARSFIQHFSETFEILFSIHRVEGWRSLFRGLGPSLTGVVPATAIKFYAYGNCKRLYPEVFGLDRDATSTHALSAATAGVVTGTATNPIWLVKTRLQLDRTHVNTDGTTRPPQYRNSYDCVKQVVRQEGVKGLYRGLAASYLGVIETTLHLASYERIKVAVARHYERKGKTQSGEVTQGLILSGSAAVSKLIAVLIAYPHEVRTYSYLPY
jgi:solute carrier family 25 protein 33/36